jgi:hypothetical protein
VRVVVEAFNQPMAQEALIMLAIATEESDATVVEEDAVEVGEEMIETSLVGAEEVGKDLRIVVCAKMVDRMLEEAETLLDHGIKWMNSVASSIGDRHHNSIGREMAQENRTVLGNSETRKRIVKRGLTGRRENAGAMIAMIRAETVAHHLIAKGRGIRVEAGAEVTKEGTVNT